MRLVYKFRIKTNDKLLELCKISKNLYNQTLYAVKEERKNNNKWLFYQDLNKIMQTTKNLEGTINYRLLKAQVSQQCIKQVDSAIKAYIKAVKDYKQNPEKYTAMPQMPNYKRDTNLLVYTNQCCQMKNGYIVLSKSLKIRIPQIDKYSKAIDNFQQVRIIPNNNGSYTVEIVYNDDTIQNQSLDSEKYASIDLGVNNLVTLLLSDGSAILYNGKQVKSKNQYFNKTTSQLKSRLKGNKKSSKRIKNLWERRENQINDIFHKLSRQIVRTLISEGIGNIVVGYNDGWKDSVRISNRNNQTFVFIPHEKFIQYLTYKCKMCGIKVIKHEESYTSKCDGLALETIEKHDEYLGKRKKRGLFQSSTGKLINADVNGALNIMRKVVGNSAIISKIINSGRLFRPLRVSIL